MNYLEIGVIAVTALLCISGFRKGFVRKLASLLSLALSIGMVYLALPYVSDFIKEKTGLYDTIAGQCREVLVGQVNNLLTKEDGSIDRSLVKSFLEQSGYDSSSVDKTLSSLDDEELQDYIEQYLGLVQQTGLLDAQFNPTSAQQTELIESLPLPDIVKNLLLAYNNDEGYQQLEVQSFIDYICSLIANILLRVIAFVVSVLAVHLILRILIHILDRLTHFPVLGGINRAAGLALGLVEALALLWIFFLLISVFSATETGSTLLSMVQESTLLSRLYNSNLFLDLIMQTLSSLG